MYRILFTTLFLCISLTSAGLIAPAPLVYSQGIGHVGPAIAVKHAVATSYANSNLVAVHPSVVQIAHAAPVVHAAPVLQAAPVLVSSHGLGLGGVGLGGLGGVGLGGLGGVGLGGFGGLGGLGVYGH